MVKQCHKPPTTGNGNHTTYLYKNSEIGNALWHCFTTIGPWIATSRGWLIHDQNLECLALIFLQFADAAYWKSWNYDMEAQTFKDLRMWVHVIYDIYIYRIWIDNFIIFYIQNSTINSFYANKRKQLIETINDRVMIRNIY